MDVSPEYIKMCENAEEMQKQSPDYRDCGHDIYFVCSKCHILAKEDDGSYWSPCDCGKSKIWLPRLDELWNMLLPKEYNVLLVLESVWGHIRLEEKYYSNFGASLEQLLLAYIVKSFEKKIWNGEDWIAL